MEGRKCQSSFQWDDKNVSRATYFRKKRTWQQSLLEDDDRECGEVNFQRCHYICTWYKVKRVHYSNWYITECH